MSKIRLNINGREVAGFEGQTILEIARAYEIDIPSLCHDERVEHFASCGICEVEVVGNPKLLRSCSTLAANGMVVNTESARAVAARKAGLELLLSNHTGDCRPPCVLACPAQTDCQGYVGLIANGQYDQAVALVKDKVPLPASIGRVCPHPCEDACRREMVEEPIAIAALKQFVGDLEIAKGELYTAQVGASTGKSVAIIGGGPGGLSAAYFLRAQGHEVAIYDTMPKMGGMLRYGIPEYRLPKKLLDAEVDAIEGMGVHFVGGVKVGKDVSFDYLRESYDAVLVAIGAWSSTGLGCPGEELEGVLGGIDFLRDVALQNPVITGQKVAVVGGGNTAMDACRTAIRLGASEVYNIYRRTRNEMPAQEIEIIEAEEEGVIFKNLTNPIELVGEGGKVKAVRLQVMELGEPDASGRRRPVPVAGKEEVIEIDSLIVAIGQRPRLDGFEELSKTKWETIIADEQNYLTNLPGVFAIGDVTNNGADIAITAIGEAVGAAEMIGRYLDGEQLSYTAPYLVTAEKTAEDFAEQEKASRAKMPHRAPQARRGDFLEVNLGFTEEEAKREAGRCLECGCLAFFGCKLLEFADRYKVQPEKYEGKVCHSPADYEHPFIIRDPDKCILCGLCVRICEETVGATALGFVGRGFETLVAPALSVPLSETDCISCGQCAHACPTGALGGRIQLEKQTPLQEKFAQTTCSFCSVGCGIKLAYSGNLLTRALPGPGKADLLCAKGRFGFGEIAKQTRPATPLIQGEEADFDKAFVYANKSLQGLQTRYGANSVGVAISERYTAEEAFLIKQYATKALGTDKVYSFSALESGIGDVLSRDCSTSTFDELENTSLVVAVAPDSIVKKRGVAGMKIRRAVSNGAKLMLLSDEKSLLDNLADLNVQIGGDLQLLREITKVLLDSNTAKAVEGYQALADSLKDAKPGEAAKACAEMIAKAPSAVFVFDKSVLSAQAAKLIANIAVLAGHHNRPRSGVIQLLPGANSQGLTELGVATGAELTRAITEKEIRGLFIFGEDPRGVDLGKLDFLAVQDIHLTATAKSADVFFPASTWAEAPGSYISADGTLREIVQAVPCPLPMDTLAQVSTLAEQAGLSAYWSFEDIQKTMLRGRPTQAGGQVSLVPTGQEGELYRPQGPSANALCSSIVGKLMSMTPAK